MDPNLAPTLALAVLIIAVSMLNWWHTKTIAKRLAATVEIATKTQNQKLDDIYKLANSRLSDALQTIEDLKALLAQSRHPDDPRIKQAIAKNS